MSSDWTKDREICDAATGGPWDARYCKVLVSGPGGFLVAQTYRRDADAAFLAAARTRWPAALDEIERLRAALEIAIDAQQCECSTDDARRFARERDAARAEVERLREGIRGILKNTFTERLDGWGFFGAECELVLAGDLRALLEGGIEDGLGT